MEGYSPSYKILMDLGISDIIGFEPNINEFNKLKNTAR